MKKLFRYLFGKCDYCGNLLRNGGGKGTGTVHYVWKQSNPNKKIYACFKCEMGFDED